MAYPIEPPVSAGMSDTVQVRIEEVTDGLVEVVRPGRVAARAANFTAPLTWRRPSDRTAR
ncbi:hypothetical protein [Streptomyces sp. NPDC059894]|uniref:hypothetical protein n=1 Tax=unclassified Streptomyces TaxID=2593676 RepID=UPI0036471220